MGTEGPDLLNSSFNSTAQAGTRDASVRDLRIFDIDLNAHKNMKIKKDNIAINTMSIGH